MPLLRFKHCPLRSLVVVIWAESHHVLWAKMPIFRPFNYVVVLQNRQTTDAATKSCFLAELSCYGRRSVTRHVNMVLRVKSCSAWPASIGRRTDGVTNQTIAAIDFGTFFGTLLLR